MRISLVHSTIMLVIRPMENSYSLPKMDMKRSLPLYSIVTLDDIFGLAVMALARSLRSES